MPRLKPIVASTPEELAAALGLSAAEAKEWQVQHVLLKRLSEVHKPAVLLVTHDVDEAIELARRYGTAHRATSKSFLAMPVSQR